MRLKLMADRQDKVAHWQLRDRPRRALVIGQSRYPTQPLAHAAQDASKMHAKLQGSLGFDATLVHNATRSDLLYQLDTWQATIARDSRQQVALFYFSGHGSERNGNNLLSTVDAGAHGAYIDLQQDVIKPLNKAGKGNIIIIILDCCRADSSNDTFKADSTGLDRDFSETFKRNAEATPRANEVLMVFACDPGRVAYENSRMGGVLTHALLQHIGEEESILEVFQDVMRSVHEAYGGKQNAWVSLGSFITKFSLSWRGSSAPSGATHGGSTSSGQQGTGALLPAASSLASLLGNVTLLVPPATPAQPPRPPRQDPNRDVSDAIECVYLGADQSYFVQFASGRQQWQGIPAELSAFLKASPVRVEFIMWTDEDDHAMTYCTSANSTSFGYKARGPADFMSAVSSVAGNRGGLRAAYLQPKKDKHSHAKNLVVSAYGGYSSNMSDVMDWLKEKEDDWWIERAAIGGSGERWFRTLSGRIRWWYETSTNKDRLIRSFGGHDPLNRDGVRFVAFSTGTDGGAFVGNQDGTFMASDTLSPSLLQILKGRRFSVPVQRLMG